LDGEIVVLDTKGVSQFNALMTTKGRDAAVFYAFDLIWLNGADLRSSPLVERKAQLCKLVSGSRCPRLLYAQHIEGAGKQFFHEICRRDLEGVVGKRKNGLYREDRPDWVKIKNSSYSQAGRGEAPRYVSECGSGPALGDPGLERGIADNVVSLLARCTFQTELADSRKFHLR
jgi:hypothetical protein